GRRRAAAPAGEARAAGEAAAGIPRRLSSDRRSCRASLLPGPTSTYEAGLRRVRLVLGRLLLVRSCRGAPALDDPAVVVEAVVDAVEPAFESGRDHHAQDAHVFEHAVLALG